MSDELIHDMSVELRDEARYIRKLNARITELEAERDRALRLLQKACNHIELLLIMSGQYAAQTPGTEGLVMAETNTYARNFLASTR